ncbi:glycosyltransferase [Lonsdalea populi]|uniref:Glycosyltransferase 2-like domain-containing protein n=5 Tax=Lonsdalea TaxID=1082702 RepID=A0ABX9ESY4_9GAMM|nr:glycosyltransferase [Lonsdalea populi]RAT20099.1 hypothetical protein AU487_08920 [Lonsdalea populi]RAT24261.1 hypothetical protein AU488_08260 [Lonsdalea populi]RAT27978.1 hypothetical protein AU489_02690 [Lonsdalea populi]RAT37223.1 hypothetical protein AU492_02775 [Lonsdalea populi]RAT39704.1 hypothetical protein AU493_00355 [Lonsdalea populi]
MNKFPLVSIIIPAQEARYFELALISATLQDYDNVEIIVHDASADTLIESAVYKAIDASRHPIRYFRCESRDVSEYDLSAESLMLAEGKYINFLSDGDVLREDHVRLLTAVMEDDDSVVLSSSRRRRIDGEGQILDDIVETAYPFSGNVQIRGQSVIQYLTRYATNFVGELSCVLMRQEMLSPETLFTLNGVKLNYTATLALYLSLLRDGNLAMLSEPLTDRRVPAERADGSISGPEFQEQAMYFRKVQNSIFFSPDVKNPELLEVADLDQKEHFYPFDLKEGMKAALEGKPEENTTPDWIASRYPTPSESVLIKEYLGQHLEGREFGILIMDTEGDEEKLKATVESLETIESDGVLLKRIILTSSPEIAVRFPSCTVREIRQEILVRTINDVVREQTFDWLMLVQAGEIFTAGGLLMTSLGLVTAQGCSAIYGDELLYGKDGQLGLSCRPDFNLDYLLSLPAVMTRHWLFNRELFLSLGGFDTGHASCMELEYILRLIERQGMGAIGHLAEFLTISDELSISTHEGEMAVLERHLQRRGYDAGKAVATLPGHYRMIYGHQESPLVSIIIPTKDQLPMLVACVTSLLEKTRYSNYELLIVDNNSETPEAKAWLDGVAKVDPNRIRVIRYPHPFNYSAINNMAAEQARGDYLLLLNNDTAVVQPDWLDNMLNHALRPEVGIVGAKLIYPDGRIQHGGVILGLRGPAEHPFSGDPMDAPGYMQRLKVDQNYSVVTAACLMIRKSVYQQVDGLDEEAFTVSYNDADLCLKVREAGYLTVWTPFATVMHEGSVSQTKVDTAAQEAKRKRFQSEQMAMYEKWLPVIARDPAYNINLSLNGRGFEVEPDAGLIWRPLTWRPLPVVMAHMSDQTGCGHYRIIKPFNALKDANMIDGKLSNVYLNTPTLARYEPEVLVLQKQVSAYFHDWIERISKLSNTFKIYELDDYLPNLPLKSVHRAGLPKDVLKAMRKSLGFMDRFVVSTQPMAEAFTGLHDRIHVVENRLPVAWWSNLSALRRQGKKPRIGWGGGSSHTGDLELIADIVRDLADDVEWVFFGMCPEKLRPYIHEFHKGVDIDLYPKKLASLNLDLALAPLEENIFNRCKSNLRLLEYGACGYPVICTDIEPYQCDLPVTRVRNRYKDWMDAIRMHLADLDATARMGDELRRAVYRDWMLSGDNLLLWQKAWLPD